MLLWGGAAATGITAAVVYAMARSARDAANAMTLRNDEDKKLFDERVDSSTTRRAISVALLATSATCATVAWWRGRNNNKTAGLGPSVVPWRRGLVMVWDY